jgi:hypothetical protein
MTMLDDKLAVLDLYERYTSDGEMFLTGAFGGVKLSFSRSRGQTLTIDRGGYIRRRGFKASIVTGRVRRQR